MSSRYLPQPMDFIPDPKHINSSTPESITYRNSVLSRGTLENRIYETETGERGLFALGSVLIKSGHLEGDERREHALADANEVAANALTGPALAKLAIEALQIDFANKVAATDPHALYEMNVMIVKKIQGRSSVLVQERISGVGLGVAWQYLSTQGKTLPKTRRAASCKRSTRSGHLMLRSAVALVTGIWSRTLTLSPAAALKSSSTSCSLAAAAAAAAARAH